MSCFGINGCSNCMTFLFPCVSIRVRACADFIISMYLLMILFERFCKGGADKNTGTSYP